MKYKNPLLVVSDMERSKAFYKEVLGLRILGRILRLRAVFAFKRKGAGKSSPVLKKRTSDLAQTTRKFTLKRTTSMAFYRV